LIIELAGDRVRSVTLGGDPGVPVMVRVGGILQFHRLEPGIFSRRLIKMTVDADVLSHDILRLNR